jgi:hypothetical protein
MVASPAAAWIDRRFWFLPEVQEAATFPCVSLARRNNFFQTTSRKTLKILILIRNGSQAHSLGTGFGRLAFSITGHVLGRDRGA